MEYIIIELHKYDKTRLLFPSYINKIEIKKGSEIYNVIFILHIKLMILNKYIFIAELRHTHLTAYQNMQILLSYM